MVPKWHQKSMSTSKGHFSKNRPSKLVSIIDAIWVPTWPRFGLQNPPTSTQNPIPRGIQKLIDFCFDFVSIWAPFWEPSWNHVGYQDAPKTPQDAPKTPQDAPRCRQDAPKTPQHTPKTPKEAPRCARRPKTPPLCPASRASKVIIS